MNLIVVHFPKMSTGVQNVRSYSWPTPLPPAPPCTLSAWVCPPRNVAKPTGPGTNHRFETLRSSKPVQKHYLDLPGVGSMLFRLFLHSHHGPWYLTLTPCVLHINGNHMASSVDFRKHVCASASACAYACSAVCAVMWCDVMQPKNTTSCDAYYIII